MSKTQKKTFHPIVLGQEYHLSQGLVDDSLNGVVIRQQFPHVFTKRFMSESEPFMFESWVKDTEVDALYVLFVKGDTSPTYWAECVYPGRYTCFVKIGATDAVKLDYAREKASVLTVDFNRIAESGKLKGLQYRYDAIADTISAILSGEMRAADVERPAETLADILDLARRACADRDYDLLRKILLPVENESRKGGVF
jgi:hypothetical protein